MYVKDWPVVGPLLGRVGEEEGHCQAGDAHPLGRPVEDVQRPALDDLEAARDGVRPAGHHPPRAGQHGGGERAPPPVHRVERDAHGRVKAHQRQAQQLRLCLAPHPVPLARVDEHRPPPVVPVGQQPAVTVAVCV